jgi:hypothetical protein
MSDYRPDKWLMVKMGDGRPDKWVIIKIGDGNLYKIFACWYGGYAGSDSWKLNSGITSVTREGNTYLFNGSSGSVYECHIDSYGTNFYGGSVLAGMIENAAVNGVNIEILDENVDPMTLIYE